MEMRLCMLLVIQELQLKGRAYARDIARQAGIENGDAVKALVELEKRGKVQQANGYWWLYVELPEEVKKSRGKKL
jgi:predicted Rossmann fold nucleotide-binding protein DprA/Smf involved in DNA uptake